MKRVKQMILISKKKLYLILQTLINAQYSPKSYFPFPFPFRGKYPKGDRGWGSGGRCVNYMKPKFYIYLIVLLLIIMSCTPKSNINMLTVIHADGSCDKEFQNTVNWRFMLGDTARQNSTAFPVKIDTAVWQVSWQYREGETQTRFPINLADIQLLKIDTTKSDADFQFKIRKHFKSVDEMSRFASINTWNGAKIHYSLNKQFRWFYTYYTYTETYPKLQLTNDLTPVSKYFTDAEAQYWFNETPDLTSGMNGLEINDLNKKLEEKYNQWMSHILWNEYYKVYIENYDKLNLPLSQVEFTQLSDTLFEKEGHDAFNLEKLEIDKVLDKHFQTKSFSEFAVKNDTLFNLATDKLLKMDFFEQTTHYNYSLQLPGKALNGNYYAQTDDGALHWNVTSARMFLQDYVIRAESRKANWWAFAITFIILAAAIVSYFVPKKRTF